MTFFFKFIVLLFILIYCGTEASIDLTNISDPKDITLIVNTRSICSLIQTYFRGICEQKLIKNSLSSNEYISNCIDYLRENISFKNIKSYYIFSPNSLLPKIPKNYQKIAVLHSKNTNNSSEIIFTNKKSKSNIIYRLFSSLDSYAYFEDNLRDDHIPIESKSSYHELMDYIKFNTNEFGVVHENFYPFDDDNYKIVKRIKFKDVKYNDDYYLMSNREYDEYSNIYYHLFSQNIGNDYYWSFPSETDIFTKSQTESSLIYENKVVNEWNITINTDNTYTNDNIQIQMRNCNSFEDYEVESTGKCINTNRMIKYKLRDGIRCINGLKDEELVIYVNCKNKYSKEMIGLCFLFLIIIFILEILLIIYRNNIVIIKMNRIFPLVIPILSFFSIYIMYWITSNIQTDNKAYCVSIYLMHFIISSLLSKVIILFFWYNKESVKDPTHFVKHSILSMLLLFLISPDIIIYIIMIFISPMQITSEIYDMNGFAYNLNFCEIHITNAMSIIYILMETFYLFYCFNDIYDLLEISSFQSECFYILLSATINVTVYITNILLFFKNDESVNHSFTIFLFYSLSNIIMMLVFYVPIFVKILKEDKRIAPIESFKSVISDPFLSYFFQCYSKCNDRYNDVYSFYISCVEYEKCITREGAELLYEQLFSYGNLPIDQKTIDTIQDVISDRNRPINDDLFFEAKKQILKYLEEEVYPGFLHCDILNSLYTILPDVQKIESTDDSCRKAMICVITYSMTQRPSNLLPYSNVLHGQSTLNSRYSINKSNATGLLNTLVSSVLVAEDVIKQRKSRQKSLNRSSLTLHTTGTSSTTTGTGRKRRGIEGRESDEISHSSIIKPLKTNQLFNITNEMMINNNNNNICRDNDSVDKKSRKSMLHSFVTDDMYRMQKSVRNNNNGSIANSPNVTAISLNPFNRRIINNNENNNNESNNNNVNDNSIIGGKRRLGNIGIDMDAFEDALRQLENDSKSECSN